jgi:hypothetical protein
MKNSKLLILLLFPLSVFGQTYLIPPDTIYWYNGEGQSLIIIDNDIRYNQYPYFSSVTITGDNIPGETLTANPTYEDRENDSAGTHLYQWYLTPDSTLANALILTGETDDSLTLPDTASTYFPLVRVTPKALTGGRTGREVVAYGGEVEVGTTWAHTMMLSYVDINDEMYTFSQAQKDTIENILGSSYIISTFGPDGLDKDTCDFLLFLENSNTTTNINTQTNTKTGETIRWMVGYDEGDVVTQNDLPAITCKYGWIVATSEDGFASMTQFTSGGGNGFINHLPLPLMTGLVNLYCGGNGYTSDLSTWTVPVTIDKIYLYSNPQLTGDCSDWVLPASATIVYIYSTSLYGGIPQITPHATNALNYRAYSCDFTNADNLTTFRKGMTLMRIENNAFPSAKVDALLDAMVTYYTANAPTANCTLNISGDDMGAATVSKVDALKAIWTTAEFTLTVTE